MTLSVLHSILYWASWLARLAGLSFGLWAVLILWNRNREHNRRNTDRNPGKPGRPFPVSKADSGLHPFRTPAKHRFGDANNLGEVGGVDGFGI